MTLQEIINHHKKVAKFDLMYLDLLKDASKQYKVSLSEYMYGVMTGRFKNLRDLGLMDKYRK